MDTGQPERPPGGSRSAGARLGEAWRLVGVALRFLTRLPLPPAPTHPGDLRRAAGALPLVGLVVAGVAVAARALVEPLLGRTPATVVALGAVLAVTGALHADGLADTVDGLWGGQTPERRLAIMRDSRIGTYGVLALAFAEGLRVALLLPLDLGEFARAVACGQVLSRAAWLPLAARLPPASPGLGAELTGPQGVAGQVSAAVLAVGTALVATGAWAAVPLLAAVVALAGCERLLRRRLGGVTGDTFGFTQEVVDLAVLAAVVALLRAGAA